MTDDPASGQGRKRIAVIGAGVAGLTAAYRLAAAGHQVTVLETQSRVGGRALTLRSSLSAGLVPQAGPARFPDSCERVMSLARHFRLELAPFYPSAGRVVAFRLGTRETNHAPTQDDFWEYPVSWSRLRVVARRILGRPAGRTYRFREGTDRLTDALADATKADFRLGATVHTLIQDGAGVHVRFRTAQGEETSVVDDVVCAVPLSILPDLTFVPALGSAHAALAGSIPFSSAVRTFLEMRRPYWRDGGFNGFAVTDTLGEIWDPHFDTASEPALLVCYATDTLADRLTSFDERARIEHAVDRLEDVFPGARDHFVRGASISWREQPWIRGGWPLVRNGYEPRIGVLRQPHGRVFFAGDYAASPSFLNTVEGAIESGESAAALIDRARRP